MNYQPGGNNERRYPAMGEDGQNIMITAEEKL